MPADRSTAQPGQGDGEAAAVSSGSSARRVPLICPPFQHPRLSSIAVARLSTYLRANGIHCEEAYLHFELMRIVGEQRYLAAIDRRLGFTTELLFAEALHDRLGTKWQDLLAEHFGSREERQEKLARFEARCVARVEAERPDIVGITTSYNQLLPALWIARIIKRRGSRATVVLGGTACSEPLGAGILEGYPEIDRVVSGYGEQPLLDLCRDEAPEERALACHRALAPADLPLPDYRPFMREAEEYGLPRDLRLQYQSSTGCWWGQKRHCTFCGLNGSQMTYEARTSEQVISDVRTLWERHGCNLNATDCILSRRHLKVALPRLSKFAERPWLFYELKANLTEDQVMTLAEARVVGQVGIETLSTRLLELMDKGGSAIRILALLKWCRERGAKIVWNLLYAIPGERAEDYDGQIALMEKIPHLQPPRNVNPVHIDRYSPYFDRWREFGWSAIEPAPEYRQAHPHLNEAALFDIAYHFRGVGGPSPAPYLDRLMEAFEGWKARHGAGDGLFLHADRGLIRFEAGVGRAIHVNGVGARIIGLTHRVASIDRVVEQAGCEEGELERLADQGIIHLEGDRVVNLVVRLRPKEVLEA